MGAKRWAIAAVAALVAGLVMPVTAASAATVYTWVAGWTATGDAVPGADHRSWGNANNWSPPAVPGAGDTVLLTNARATHGYQPATELEVPPGGVTVASMSIDQRSGGSVYLTVGSVTVTDSFSWTGGSIQSAIHLAPTASGTIGAGTLKSLHAGITVDGSLTVASLGAAGGGQLLMYPDYAEDNAGITITRSGALTFTGKNLLTGTDCCETMAAIVNRGTVTVKSGTTTFSSLQFDQLGTVKVAKKARLVNTVGAARLGKGASYAGGGTLEFTETAKIAANPDTSDSPGGILMQGKGTLVGKTHLVFGQGAKLSGVGKFVGKGALDFTAKKNTANQSATIYGTVKTGPKVTVKFAGKVAATLGVADPGLKGYHGVLKLGGKTTVAKKKSLVAAAGTKTTITKGGTLILKPKSTFGGGDCCTDMARLTIARGAVLKTPKASQAKATLLRVKLVVKGTVKPKHGNLVHRR